MMWMKKWGVRTLGGLAVVSSMAACATPEENTEPTGETGPAARPSFEIRLDSESSDLNDFTSSGG